MSSSTSADPQIAWADSLKSREEDEGIDVLDLFLSVFRSKLQIALWTLLFLAVGLGISLSIKPVFTAIAVIMLPQQDQSAASALVGQLRSLNGLSAVSGLGL
jgi:LPS O-antigen subunit length determinant protein (WzzB/FepE family)